MLADDRDGMGTSSSAARTPIRLLVVAPRPFQLDDLEVGEQLDIERRMLVRRPGQVSGAIDELRPDLVVVDVAQFDDHGAAAIEAVTAADPGVGVLALASAPPTIDQVARASSAGAHGFVDFDAPPDELIAAMQAVRDGELWFPAVEVRPLLDDISRRLELTAAERRSRLTNILLGIIPLTGVIAALLAYLWRKYMGQIGVRPVDMAVDPASRIVDAIVGLSLLLGALGPLLFVGNWLDMLRIALPDRGPIAWLLRRNVLAHLLMSAVWLVIAWFATRGPDPLLVMVVGPVVAVAVTARAMDLDDQLPRFLHVKTSPVKMLIAGVAALLVFVAALGGEALFVGPELGRRGENGFLVPRVIGFNAQPVEAYNINTGDPPRQLLYLGGNADLYVLVDPCNDDEVEFVSVSTQRLVVIDEISCAS